MINIEDINRLASTLHRKLLNINKDIRGFPRNEDLIKRKKAIDKALSQCKNLAAAYSITDQEIVLIKYNNLYQIHITN